MAQITSGSLTIVDVTDGAPGLNNTTVFLYRRAVRAPDKPTGNLTYTFATASITGALEGWVQSIDELTGSNPIWMIAAVASSNGETDVIESSEWAGPIKMAQNGQDGLPGTPGTNGLNQATIFIYKRADSATAPSNTTYTFATGGFTVPSGWSKTIPTEPKGKPCWVTSAIAISAEATAELKWAAPSVLVEDGADGVSPTVTKTENGVKIDDGHNVTYITNGKDGTSYYTFVRYSENSNGSGYVDTPTSETIYIGVYTGTKSSPPAYNDSGWTWSKYVGADGQPGTRGPTGPTGPQGVSVTSTRELYYLKTNSTDPAQITNANQIHTTDDVNQWTSVVPTYIGSGKYYTCIETTLSNGNVVWSAPVENKGLTNANVNAANAIEIARGVKQHFFWVATDKSANIPAGAYVAEESEESFYSNPTKGNILTRSDGIWIRNGVDKLATLQGSGLTFLVPIGTYKGQKSVSLNGSGLTFYNIGSSNSAAATLASDGLQITNGSIVLGTTSGTSAGNVTLSNKNFTRSINGTSHNDLRFAIGSKFGVASDGTLYSSGLDSVVSRVDKAETKLAGTYALSQTSAGTAAKAATIMPSLSDASKWELTTGTMVTVKFTNANTAANPTLNINSKGAKAIKTYAGGNLSADEYKWKAGSTFTFTYNGANWLMQDSTASVRMNSAESRITHTATSIESVVANNDTYTAPDGTTKTNTIKSAIKQNADKIELKVSKDGVIASINASVEESGGSAVKIRADKVNITGTTVFSDGTSIQSRIDAVEVGGRNLLVGTGTSISKATTATSSYVVQILYDTPNLAMLSDLGFAVDDEVTLSFDWKITSASTYGNARIEWYGKTSSAENSYIAPLINPFATFSASNTSGHVTKTVKLTSATVQAKRLVLRIDNSNLTLTISNLKLEKGNKATDWSPAPEDVTEYTDNAVNSIEIGGRNLAVNTSGEDWYSVAIADGTNKVINLFGATDEYCIDIPSIAGVKVGDLIQVSFDVKFGSNWTATGTGTKRSYIQGTYNRPNSWKALTYDNGGGNQEDNLEAIMASSSKEGHIHTWFVVTSNMLDGTYTGLTQSNVRFDYYSGTVSVRHVMVEKATKPSGWSPAPEDVQAEIDAKRSVHTIRATGVDASYTYAQLLTFSARTTTLTWNLESVSGVKVGDTVRVGVAVSNMDDALAYILCEVTAVDSTNSRITGYSHGLDTTIIDGGNILTNSIGADKIKVNEIEIGAAQITSGTIATARIPNLDAGKITTGTINIGRIPNDALNSNIEVGGRNLLLNSSNMPFVSSGIGGYRASGGTASHITITDPPISGISGGIRITNSGTSAARIGLAQDHRYNTFIVGEKYSQSFWIRASTSFTSTVDAQMIWRAPGQTTGPVSKSMTLTTSWQYVKGEGATLQGTQADYYSAGYVYASNVPAGAYIEVCADKVEKGTKATDWTPSPEDEIGKNLLSYPYLRDSLSGATYTTAGITFTLNDDGTVTAKGTATGNAWYQFSSMGHFACQRGHIPFLAVQVVGQAQHILYSVMLIMVRVVATQAS